MRSTILQLLGVSLSLLASCAHPTASAPVGGVVGLRNPEDLVELAGSPWVIVSSMKGARAPGGLYAFDSRRPYRVVRVYASAPSFAPHGIAARRSSPSTYELLVVDHGGGEAIDRFELTVTEAEPRAALIERIALPEGAWANGVVPLDDGGFATTSMYDPRDAAFIDRLARAEPTGGVLLWSRRGGWSAGPGPRMSGANGIATDGESLFVSEWAAHRVWKLPLAGGDARSVAVDFLPDNLRWRDDGTLLVTGQRARPEDVLGCEERGARCPRAFAVVDLAPATLTVRPVLDADDAWCTRAGFGGATVAITAAGSLWLGSFTGDRVARLPSP